MLRKSQEWAPVTPAFEVFVVDIMLLWISGSTLRFFVATLTVVVDNREDGATLDFGLVIVVIVVVIVDDDVALGNDQR